MNAIETHDLKKYYGKHPGIRGMNMTVREGDMYGFAGPNGAGKSTTIRTLLGFIKPSGGTAGIFGMDCVKMNARILEQVGYMPSEAMFYADMRVSDIIRLAEKLHRRSCGPEAQKLCERFGVDGKKKIRELSLGNRKKVSIVCAMQHRPRLLILDEPTSGLDPLMQKEFFDVLEEYRKEGATILLSSHNLSEIQAHCNRLGIVRDGRMVVENDISAFAGSGPKKVRLRLSTDTDCLGPDGRALFGELFADCAGFSKVGRQLSFLYNGDVHRLMRWFGTMEGSVDRQNRIEDLFIEEADLAEVILHVYDKA